ncbi:MucB/RseB C-terminal domain-containing protein [Leeia sp. TBRC 13508]|uniref:MucB/RseB C-terminal domain-containing protein n=1 Tax=Leeia speluncae TaxID=2884804 RepID=A0ABS8D242_9NEIS|nr:MucB/RseB C-terminal domain-containing protein [Leeia speluncae]MCB6182247.1 MucB/RseB C-terminal domain-containing protein [Leeia speluncae]
MRVSNIAIGVACVIAGSVAYAGQSLTPQEAIQLLTKVNNASRQMTFSGLYVYQRGGMVETSRISHAVIGGTHFEKIETVDGPPQELIVQNDAMSCYVPSQHDAPIDLRASDHFFPSVLPADIKQLLTNYQAMKQDVERVAENDCQMILLVPKDNLRNPFRFCYEPSTGVILKSQRFNDNKELSEQMAFSQIKLGGELDRSAFKPKFPKKIGTWQRQSKVPQPDDILVNYKNLPAGFKLVHGGKRQFPGKSKPISHYLFSDGLSSVSVFVDKSAEDASVQNGLTRKGATNVYVESEGNVVMMILGEVPPSSVQLFGLGLEIKK